MKRKFGILIISGIILAVLASGCVENPAQTTDAGKNAVSVTAANGLRLSLTMDAKTYQSGQAMQINFQDTNTLSIMNRLPDADNWAVKGLSYWECIPDFPIGVAVYSGYYAPADISKGTPLVIHDPDATVWCPTGASFHTWLNFKPHSDIANIDAGLEPPFATEVELTGTLNFDGWFSSDQMGSQRFNFAPGTYTLAASDKWGALVITHFTVAASDSGHPPVLKVLSVTHTDAQSLPNPQSIEVDVQNISDKTIVALSGFYIADEYFEEPFYFEVTADKPLLSGANVVGYGDAVRWGYDTPYTLKFNGTYQDGTNFYMTYNYTP